MLAHFQCFLHWNINKHVQPHYVQGLPITWKPLPKLVLPHKTLTQLRKDQRDREEATRVRRIQQTRADLKELSKTEELPSTKIRFQIT